MRKHLIKHGNSLALIIDKPILELLQISAETPLEITTNGNSLLISPVEGQRDDKKFEEALKKTHKQFGNALKKLSE